jgi:hypothetical protein
VIEQAIRAEKLYIQEKLKGNNLSLIDILKEFGYNNLEDYNNDKKLF